MSADCDQEAEQLIEALSAAEVFALALKGAARDMNRALPIVINRKTGEATLRHEERAKQRFRDLIATLKEDEKQKKPQQKKQQGPAPGGQQGTPPTDGIPNIAQLKLIKTMQQDLMQRTAEVMARMNRGDNITEEQQQEQQDLALEQSELADLTRNLTKFATASSQDDEAATPGAGESDE